MDDTLDAAMRYGAFILFGCLQGFAAEWSDFRNWLRKEGLPEDPDDCYREADVLRYAQDCEGAAATGDLFAAEAISE